MLPNRSPWLAELRPDRSISSLTGDEDADVVIVGAGIAGISTAYFLLKHTNARVTVLEADLVAHGASGHNAGQVTSQFEVGIPALEKEFGTELCASTLRDLERGWGLLEAMRADAAPDVLAYRFKGSVAAGSKAAALVELADLAAYKRFGLPASPMAVAQDWYEGVALKAMYPDLVRLAPHADILAALETENVEYKAYASYERMVANSALLATRVAETLRAREPHRFILHERTRVEEIVLGNSTAGVRTARGSVRTKRVVLCTNGFMGFTVRQVDNPTFDPAVLHPVEGLIGYMAGYYEPAGQKPMATSFVGADWQTPADPYFYVTRRPYATPNGRKDLVSVGGPHGHHEGQNAYTRAIDCPDSVHTDIDVFMKKTHGVGKGKPEFAFCWHGMMGYTANGVRLIGAEPRNPVLMYNLGCNGIGLLPSVYGAERIARLVNGEELPKTFFDPK